MLVVLNQTEEMKERDILQENIESLKDLSRLMKLLVAVSEMRDAQKNFFRTREATYLQESKRLEKVVDDMLLEFFSRQSKLF